MQAEKNKGLGMESPITLGKRKQPVPGEDMDHRQVPLRNETSINNRTGSVSTDPGPKPAQGSFQDRTDTAARHVPSIDKSAHARKIQDAAHLVATARQIQRDRMQQGGSKSIKDVAGDQRHAPVIGLPVAKNPPMHESAERILNSDALSENKSDEQGEQKMRLIWSQELHNRFLNALSHLGLQKAVPKNILTLMNVEGMTRENIASHLQKYRMYLKKMGGYSAKDKVSNEKLQKLHEKNVQEMASREALHQSISIMEDPAVVEDDQGSKEAEHRQPEMSSHIPDAGIPNVVEGIPISDALTQPIHMRMYHQKQALCPAVAAVGGGHFDPQSWQYPELPAEDSLSSQYMAKSGENHIDSYSHLPVKHHDDHTDIFFDGKHDNQSESDQAAGEQDEFDEDLLIDKSTIQHHE